MVSNQKEYHDRHCNSKQDLKPPMDDMGLWKSQQKIHPQIALIAVLLFGIICIFSFSNQHPSPIPVQHIAQKKPIHPILKKDIPAFLQLLNTPYQINYLIDLRNDIIRDHFDTHEENFIELQTGEEYSTRNSPLFQDERPNAVAANKRTFSNRNTKEAQQWLSNQIFNVTYNNFYSTIEINGRVFRLNEMVDEKLQLVWNDIDPIEKKLFFNDPYRQYTIQY